MPSPLGHAIAGLTVHVALGGRPMRERTRAMVAVAAALAPDLDLLLRYVDGRNHHQGPSHSIGMAVLAGLAVAAFSPRARLHLGLAAALGWASHVLLDYLSRDTRPPIGLMALWPFSTHHYKFPAPVFLDIGRTLGWATVRANLLAGAWELALLVPLLALAWLWRGRR